MCVRSREASSLRGDTRTLQGWLNAIYPAGVNIRLRSILPQMALTEDSIVNAQH